MALTGGVVFLLEWISLVGSGLVGVEQIGGDLAATPEELLAGYSGSENGMAIIAA